MVCTVDAGCSGVVERFEEDLTDHARVHSPIHATVVVGTTLSFMGEYNNIKFNNPNASPLTGLQIQTFGRNFGQVADPLDRNGDLCAGTTTGGFGTKIPGRVGDSPIIGAGTYANNGSCAVSATGTGEYFIRAVVAHDICSLVQYKGWPLVKAAQEVVQRKLVAMGGDGGIIALDPAGNVAMEFNSEGMFRGVRTGNGRREIAIYRLP